MKILARLFSFWIPFPKFRKRFRDILEYIFLCSPFFNIYVINTHLKAKKCGKHLRIGGKTKINGASYLGKYNSFNGIRVIGAGKFITGNHIQCGQEILVLTQNHNYESTHIPYGYDVVKKDVIIDSFVWIGSRVTLLPGTHIGEGAIIQGGSVVHGQIPPYSIAGGNPAKVFKQRNIEHFEKLKKEKMFYITKN
jgi:acetyltransferase-like isoleucine patch superfamily enzyme